MAPFALAAHPYEQTAFVVADLDAAVAAFERVYGLSRWSIWRDLAVGQANRTYLGEEEDFGFSAAYAYTEGGMQIELVQHDSGRTIYQGWLDGAPARLHHVGFRVDDADAYAAAMEHLTGLGHTYAMGGAIPGVGAWGYFDTRAELGLYTEVYWSAPAVLAVFDRMKAGEVFDSFPTD